MYNLHGFNLPEFPIARFNLKAGRFYVEKKMGRLSVFKEH